MAGLLSLSLSVPSLAAEKLGRVSPGVYQLFDGSSTVSGVLHRGVDLSHWQGTVDWATVAKNDVDFVFLGTRYAGEVDPLFRENAKGAEAAGIDIGVYIYSYATSVDQAKMEADFVLDLIKDYPISYPVVFDAENHDTLGALPKDQITAIVNAFCDRIREAGYYPILYANDYWLSEILDMSALSKYPVWAAAYERLPKWENYVIWQGTETGIIPGIEGGVDIDLQFRDFSANIPANSWKKHRGRDYYYENYRLVKNRLIFDGANSYFMDDDGLIFKGGWKTVQNKKRYFDKESGVMKTGLAEVEGKRYLFLEDGGLSSAWNLSGGNWYYTGTDGVVQTGVIDVGGVLYNMGTDGIMFHDTECEYNGQTWVIDSSGAMQLKPAETAAEAAEGAATGEAAAGAATGEVTAASGEAAAGAATGEVTVASNAASSAASGSAAGSAGVIPESSASAESAAASGEITASSGGGTSASSGGDYMVESLQVSPSYNAGMSNNAVPVAGPGASATSNAGTTNSGSGSSGPGTTGASSIPAEAETSAVVQPTAAAGNDASVGLVKPADE